MRGSIAFILAIFVLSLHAETVVLVAGGGAGPDNGPAAGAKLPKPFAAGIDKDGNIYVPEFLNDRIRKIDAKGVISTFAGTGKPGHKGDGGPAAEAEINWVHQVLVGPDNNLYIADTRNCCVRKIDLATNVVSTVAGTGKKGNSGDGGPAVKAEIGNIYCIAIDPKGEKLYIDDLDHKRIRAVDLKSGVISAFAGTGKPGVPANGSDAATSPLVDPRAVAADAAGNVYILERGGNALRVVDASGKIRTVVGTGKNGIGGDDGDALKAELAGPKHLCIDRDGNVIIADTDNHVIRKYWPKDGKITRVAGTGKAGSSGLNGPPESAQLSQPHGVFFNAAGELFICDSYNDRVLKISK